MAQTGLHFVAVVVVIIIILLPLPQLKARMGGMYPHAALLTQADSPSIHCPNREALVISTGPTSASRTGLGLCMPYF